MSRTTWRKSISAEMDERGETWADVEFRTIDDAELDREFSDGFGGTNGCGFTLWTRARVYFPVQYDGSEWCESVPRNPCDEVTEHVGGG